MRLRRVKNASEIINKSEYYIPSPELYKGKWDEVFGNNNPIYIEIGMGKGHFINESALKYPNINFIGIEKQESVLAKAVSRITIKDLPNLKYICLDAIKIDTVFDKEIDLIYLNFSDPWPKERHAKRRLTSDIFLPLYDKIFNDNNKIILKSDNLNLYNYSVEQFKKYNYDISVYNYNINNIPANNIMTEYEERFLNKGNIIYKIEATKNSLH